MAETDLSALRSEIDAIDAEMHALLRRRAGIAERIRGAKTDDSLKLRPGREANILRALIARHEGAFPKPQLVRIWREILSASLAMQGPFSMAVFANEAAHDIWDLARDHFGAGMKAQRFATARRVVEAVVSGAATIGIVPQPSLQDPENWWQHLVVGPNAGNDGRPARIIAKLPFIAAEAGPNTPEAYVIARAEPEASGADRSVIAIDLAVDNSTDGLQRQLAAANLEGSILAHWQDELTPRRWVHLVEVAGFLTTGDGRLGRVRDVFGDQLNQAMVIGAFAEPLDLSDAAQPASPTLAKSA
jgi:chorismate mutase